MPRIRSAKKQMRQNRAARARNRTQRTALRTALKRVRTAPTEAAYKAAEQLLDRAARKGLIHRNTAARHKSRLSKVLGAKKK